MQKDMYGLDVTTDSSDVIDIINQFTYQIMSSGKNADIIIKAAVKYPDNLLIQCYAAAFYLYAQDDKITVQALPHLQQAEKLLTKTNLREKLFYQAMTAWFKLDYELAITLLISMTELSPKDCLAAKIAEWLFYCTGQAFQAKRFLNMCMNMQKQNQKDNNFLAIYAFALELNKKYKKSAEIANKALEINFATPWAHHALSHDYLMTADIENGISAMKSFQPTWETILPVLKCHNNWHFGLFYIAQCDEENAMKIYNTKLWGTNREIVGEQLDSISFLWRMDMAGMPQTSSFKDIIKYLGQHPFEHYMPFNNAHYVYALVRAGETPAANEVIKKIESYANTISGEPYRVWHTVAKPFLKGCIAFAEQNYKLASDFLTPIIDDVFCVGGSDAQDELFLQTYYVSLLKSKQFKQAKKYFAKHLKHYKAAKLGSYWFELR